MTEDGAPSPRAARPRGEGGGARQAELLWVVPSERHVERWTRQGRRVETRTRLRGRLFDLLVRDRVAATPVESRLALAASLPAVAAADPLLASMVRAGGEAWERTLDAVDGAIGVLRAAGVRAESLARVAAGGAGGERGAGGGGGAAKARARMLLGAVQALDAALEARGLVDPRAIGALLAERIAASPPAWVAAAVGARSVAARFVLEWDGADAAWWRALDAALARAGASGAGARAELPAFEEGIDPSRARGPLDVVIDDVAGALDAPPVTIGIDAPLGDLRLAGGVPARALSLVESRAATDAEAQARAVLDAVRRALQRGCGPDEIAVAAARLDDVAVSALRRAFDEARVPLHDARGEAPARAGVVAFALRALAVGEAGLARLDVAALARSSYIDAARLGADADALSDLAYALERTPAATGAEPRAALAATARASLHGAWTHGRKGDAEGRATLALRLADAVLPPARAMTRLEHVTSARALFAALGIDPLRARGAEAALASDEPPVDVARAELHAVARDAHAWELLHAALADYEAAVARLELAPVAVAPHTFRHELSRALEARGGRPAAARAGAVRVATLGELAAERLALLVVIDANEGALPSRGDGDPLLHEALATALRAIDPVRAPASSTVRASRELASLALAASSARAIVFTRRARDEDGAAMAPSPVVAWLERGGVVTSSWRASPLDGPAVTAREARLRRVAHGGARPARRTAIERTREGRFERESAPADPILGDLEVSGPLHAEVTRALAAETGGGDRALAVTALERFATCAFQGYAAQVLHARHERPLRELPDAREHGTLTHRALAAAFVATAPLWTVRPRDEVRIRQVAAQAVTALLGEEGLASVLRRLALARVRAAVDAVIGWSLADEAWDFTLAEQPFGDGRPGSWGELALHDATTRLALRGSIDRVDVGHGRAAVRAIDYKTSKAASESGMRALGDTTFQIALYARVASNALRTPERAGLYVSAARPGDVGPKTKKDFEARWASLHAGDGPLTPLEGRALDIVRRVRLGAIAPRPSDDGACARCDVSGGCRKPRFAIARDDDEGGAPA